MDFTARDFDTNVKALQEFVRSRAPEQWNSFFPGDLGQTLLEMVAYDQTISGYTIDKGMAELFVKKCQTSGAISNFALLLGYQIRRATPAVLTAQIELLQSQDADLVIPYGQVVRDQNGQQWEVSQTTRISAGNFYPVQRILTFGQVKSGTTTAYVTLKKGSSYAVFSNWDGARLPSEVGWGVVREGQILVLTGQRIGNSLGPAPDATRSQYAITSVGNLLGDLYGRSVLFLDRPWDLDDFTGTWTVEDRQISLTQRAHYIDQFVVQGDNRDYLELTTRQGGVVGNSKLSFLPAGSQGELAQESAVSVSVNGIPWSETNSLALSQSGDKVFELVFDGQDRARVRFGDGVRGSLLPAGARVLIDYYTTSGLRGNLMVGTFRSSFEVGGVAVSISNPYTRGTGGSDKESVEQAKAGMIRWVRTNDRAVTPTDYETLALTFRDRQAGSAALARAIRLTNAVPRETNLVALHVWGRALNGQLVAPSDHYKRMLLAFLTPRKMFGDEPVVVDGKLKKVPLHVRYRFNGQDPVEAVRTVLNKQLIALEPGQNLRLSDLYEAIEAIPEVDYAHLFHPYEDLPGVSDTAFVNSLIIPQLTQLTQPVNGGATTMWVNDPSLFSVGSTLMLMEVDKHPTVTTVESISGGLVTVSSNYPSQANYSTNARVFNSDLWLVGWNSERPVDIALDFQTGPGIESAEMARQLGKRVRDYINQDLLPGESLTKQRLENLFLSVINVTSASARFRGYMADVQAFRGEKIQINTLTINGNQY